MLVMRPKNTQPNIAVLGVGHLGSRYIQGLLSGSEALNIWLWDPVINSMSSFDSWKRTYAIDTGAHTVRFSATSGELPDHFDLVISATTADVRYESLRSFLNGKTFDYLILEKLLTTSLEDLEDLKSFVQKGKECWVNHAKRIWPIYQQLRNELQDLGSMQFIVDGSDWNMASNSVHFCDLVKWISGEELINIDCTLIDSAWRKSKRLGFLDFTGVMKYRFSQGSELLVRSRQMRESEPLVPITMTVETSVGRVVVNDEVGSAQGSLLKEELQGGTLYQSELTSSLVSDILNSGKCALPRFSEVSRDHKIYLTELLAYQQRVHANFSRAVKIT
jgi:hypothetical protein